MTRALLIAVAIIAFGLALAPHQAGAAILPDCDQTVYLVDNPQTPSAPCDSGNPNTCLSLSAAEYNDAYPTQGEKDAHPPAAITNNRNCGFNDFIQLFINLASWGLGILAVLGVLIMVWGGFTLLTSMGNQEKVREGKMTIWGSFLGITIVLISWVLVGFFVSAITGTKTVLFAGTPFARQFYGKSPCPKSYRACPNDALQNQCRDDERANANGVSKAQQILSALGCYNLAIDGCFGPKSTEGVIKFQKANAGCLATDPQPPNAEFTMPPAEKANGVIDLTTWAFLNAAGQNKQITCNSKLTSVKPCS